MALQESPIFDLDIVSDSFHSSATSSSAYLDLDRPFDHTASSSPSDSSSLSRNSSFTKLNALAPAFVPRSSSSSSLSSAALSCSSPSSGSISPASAFHPVQSQLVCAPQLPAQKIVNQVEFYFSDLNLATTDHLIMHILKDLEGYVPISVVGSFKKIKALIGNHAQLAQVLCSSTKLVVSEDGKKVKRKIPLTETDLEELQSRIVIAENLPKDHCHKSLMKIFSAIGSVKMIRTCQPQSSNGGASSGSRPVKSDSMMYSNKLHAFVEYESIELAERAVAELNDEDNWRNGLKVRLLLVRHTAKSGQARGKKAGHESEHNFKGGDGLALEANEKPSDSSHHIDAHSNELAEENGSDGTRKGRGRGKGQGQGRGRGRLQFHQNNHGGHRGASMSNVNRGSSVGIAPSNINRVGLGQPVFEPTAAAKQSSVPRMPDGTKGFSMGRGKPVAIKTM